MALSNLFLLSFLIVFTLVGSLGYFKYHTMAERSLSILFVFIYSVFIGFRSIDSGVDTSAYYDFFLLTHKQGLQDQFEIGFNYLVYISSLFMSVEVFIFLLSFIQLVFIVLSAHLLGIKNTVLVVVLFVAMLPGLDLLTNGLRSGFSLSIGILLFVLLIRSSTILKTLNGIPILFHNSYFFLAFFSLVPVFSAKSICRVICLSYILFFLWFFLEPTPLLLLIEGYSQGIGVVSRLVRYLIIEKELMSSSVKFYFIAVSCMFSTFFLVAVKREMSITRDRKALSLLTVAVLMQLVFACVSFSEYAFRFMLAGFPIQVLCYSYILEKCFTVEKRMIFALVFIIANLLITYSTATYTRFELIRLF